MLRIYGASDDLVEVEGDFTEEYGLHARETVLLIGSVESGLRVRARYAPPGAGAVWALSVEQVDEDIPLPWPVRIETAERGYSVLVVIDCPPGTPVTNETERNAE